MNFDTIGKAQTYILITLLPLLSQAQSYSCANKSYGFLTQALGEWIVQTRDRTAPGVYENNEGTAIISNSVEGCGISISFRGNYKGNPYAREAIITGIDSLRLQMAAMDSEHGGFMLYNGQIENDTLEVVWHRDGEKGKLHSKYVLSFKNPSQFDFSSFLSTNYGQTWALTHKRTFKKATELPQANFFAVIVEDVDTSIQWYSELLGFTIANRNTLKDRGIDVANLASGRNRLELISINSSLSPNELLKPNQKMQGHFKVGFSVQQLDPYIERLKALNPSFDEQVVTDPVTGQKLIVVKDPDGNRVQLFEE